MKYPKDPAPSTLQKYGMDLASYRAMWREQGGVCGFCGEDTHEKYVMDHQHVPGWKTMPPEERRKYVRGIIGVAENHWLLSRYMTTARAEMCLNYLRRYDGRTAE